jgi:hypothetical protein
VRAVKRVLLVAAVLVTLAYFFWPADGTESPQSVRAELREVLHKIEGKSGHDESRVQPSRASSSAAAAIVEPGTTPPLANPATAADGFVEVRVAAQGKPFAGAQLRL